MSYVGEFAVKYCDNCFKFHSIYTFKNVVVVVTTIGGNTVFITKASNRKKLVGIA